MIERSKSKANNSKRDRAARMNKKRRLTMEGLENRQLLAAEIYLPDVNLKTYDGPRNVGAVQALQMSEREQLNETGKNDVIGNAQLIPLGNGPGQTDTIDLRGSMAYQVFSSNPGSFSVDVDTFAFDLQAGDVLDISAFGTAGTIDLFYGNGTYWFGSEQVNGVFLPPDSPIQTVGNATLAGVVPEDGRYYLTVTPIDTSTNYTLGLRTYRPIAEQLPVGVGQVVFLDFDGGYYPNSLFSPPDPATGAPAPGIVRVPSLQESLANIGIDVRDTAALNRLINQSIEEMERQFAYLGMQGNAGDYDSTGMKGEFGITILNSRDHADPGSHPLVTRVLAGGGPVNPYGVSSTIDIGNFSMDDIVIAEVLAPPPLPLSPTVSPLDYQADFLGFLMSHEVAHSFGVRHTNAINTTLSTSDAGGGIYNPGGVDGVWGTLDDVPYNFLDDYFGDATGSGGEGIFGTNRVTDGLANTLVTGLVGGTVSGTVFNDFNRDGSLIGDAGLPGFSVFADINANGQRDAGEPITQSDSLGRYSLDVRSGTFSIIAEGLFGFAATTNPVRSTNVSAGQTSTVNFGFAKIRDDITGTAFVDSDGNGSKGSNEIGLEGVYVYADLDGDDRPDLGEPGAFSGPDGTYRINFPGAGSYTLRSDDVVGFQRTLPVDGEHTFTYDGLSLPDNYNFGFLPSLDFGDAPDSYGTTVSADGARHGILSGLSIGASVDREADGLPSLNASGDDFDNLDDEDGVRLLTPLGRDAAATFEVTTNNLTNSIAYLQGFIDFNRDGVFGIGEQVISNRPVAAGSSNAKQFISVNVPDSASLGSTIARFRLSHTSGLGATGFAESGEVEDHAVDILSAAKVANDDEFSVSRNSDANPLDVLANDFQNTSNPISIVSIQSPSLRGGVVVSGGDQLFYTPPSGFTGKDQFSYTVSDAAGNLSSATVIVNVLFQTEQPIAVDDIFEVPRGSTFRALNVLENDIASVFGGVTLINVSQGSEGGNVSIQGGAQSVRYTPALGFRGTEQFTYTIQDLAGQTSTATVTVNVIPDSYNDDLVDFSIEFRDGLNNVIENDTFTIQDGNNTFKARVYVEDLRSELFITKGVASAFADLLYTESLVSTVPSSDSNAPFPFEITFGDLFSQSQFKSADAFIPGLVNEAGAVQTVGNSPDFEFEGHSGPTLLFEITFEAMSPGIASFKLDPADNPISETILIGKDEALTLEQLRLGSRELTIVSDPVTTAIDDSFPEGRDSEGSPIAFGANANKLFVLDNDYLSDDIREFNILTNPTLGTAAINNNGTPANLNDDYIEYRVNQNSDSSEPVSGLDSFKYSIVTKDGYRSIAEATVSLGSQYADAEVSYSFKLAGNETEVTLGDRIGIEVHAQDLRDQFDASFVYAGFLDVLFDSDFIVPSDTRSGNTLGIDVDFFGEYSKDAAVGQANANGIIDEFGTVWGLTNDRGSTNPAHIATLYFDTVAVGTTSVVGSPADASPFQDTLVYRKDEPIERSKLRFESLQFQIVATSGPANQNSSFAFDVNDDGFVSPIDALLVINEMNRESNLPEGEQSSSNGSKRYYTDVNGDNRTTALDALQVINYLKRANTTQGSGEQIVLLSESNDQLSSGRGSDAFFAELSSGSDNKIASFDSVGSSSGSSNAGTVDSSSNSEDDDVLSILADDVDGRWS